MDSGLLYTSPEYSASIPENLSNVTVVTVVSTIGHRLNEPLRYTLLNAGERFVIRPTCGVILTTGVPFDREEVDSYELVVEVSREDEILRVARVMVQVQVGVKSISVIVHARSRRCFFFSGGGCERQRSRVCEPALLCSSAGGCRARISDFQGLDC